jgi:hypothetical protein
MSAAEFRADATHLRSIAWAHPQNGRAAKACDLAADVAEPSEELVAKLAVAVEKKVETVGAEGHIIARAILAALRARLIGEQP